MNSALDKILVVDFTTVRSGPTGTKILADFGAEVVRIERPGDVDGGRVFYDHADLHRNKKSLVVNLQDPRGLEIVKALVARAGVVVENYRPGVKRRLGIDYETPHETHGTVKVLGLPVSLSRTPPTVRTPAPVAGAHTRAILERLGGGDRIDALAAAGVIEVAK